MAEERPMAGRYEFTRDLQRYLAESHALWAWASTTDATFEWVLARTDPVGGVVRQELLRVVAERNEARAELLQEKAVSAHWKSEAEKLAAQFREVGNALFCLWRNQGEVERQAAEVALRFGGLLPEGEGGK